MILVRIIFCLALGWLVTACTSTPTSAPAATPAPVSDRLEGFFIQPAVNFARYQQIILTDINLRDIVIRQPSPAGKTPWALSDNDRQFYREQYIAAVVGHFVADGRYTTALDVGENVLRMDAAIVEIAPLTVPSGGEQNAAMQAYTQGMATMTLLVEIRDSVSEELLASFTDTRNLGRMWDDNNRLSHNREVRIAFEEWLGALRFYLDELVIK